jgi:hypothetical protein
MPLHRVLRRIREGRPHVAVFDLDSTLLSTQARNHVILQEYVARPATSSAIKQAATGLTADRMGWNPMDDLRAAGCDDERGLRELRGFWFRRFFTNEYLHHDEPLPGAPEYVRDVHGAGGVVVYLTGRPEVEMGAGTRASLRARRFPLGDERAHLMCKPRFDEPDLDFKRRALRVIETLGTVVGAFENEPANANLFAEELAHAEVVLLDTVCSPNAPPLHPRVSKVRDFRR